MSMSASSIHPTAIIQEGAKIGHSCEIGPFCCVGSEVTLDENVESASVDTAETAPDTGQSEQKTEEPDDKELQDVGKRAQDRIKKLTTKYKNEERAKQEKAAAMEKAAKKAMKDLVNRSVSTVQDKVSNVGGIGGWY